MSYNDNNLLLEMTDLNDSRSTIESDYPTIYELEKQQITEENLNNTPNPYVSRSKIPLFE